MTTTTELVNGRIGDTREILLQVGNNLYKVLSKHALVICTSF